ncbi:MAG: hypothetical protein RL228_1307 [Actinomycetota bacterium]|jgi:hypothetical protein
MKKTVSILLGILLSISVLSSARAAEISGNMPDAWGADLFSNGKVTVATWGVWNEDRGATDLFLAFNFNGKDSGWSEPMFYEVDYLGDIEVLDSGKIFIAYVLNESLYYQTTNDGNNFSTGTLLPQTDELFPNGGVEVESMGKIVTIVGGFQAQTGREIYSWVSNKSLTSWSRKLISDDLFPTSVFQDCPFEDENCWHRISNHSFAQNASGQQAVIVRVKLENNNLEPSEEQWVIWGFQRKTPNSDWGAAQLLDSYGPQIVDGYAAARSYLIVTPKGKVAFAYEKGFNDESPTVKIFVSNGVGKPFAVKDTGTLSSAHGTTSPNLVNIGEKIYTVFNKIPASGSRNGVKVYFGEVGKLNKAKQIGTTGSHLASQLVRLNGKFVVLSESEKNDLSKVEIRRLTGKKWSAPKTILKPPSGKKVGPGFAWCFNSPKVLACTTTYLTQPEDPQEYGSPIGLAVEFIK